ncbi:putative carbohydrate-binding protein [Pseudomonas sp. GM33]|uniref:ricin-type beta-trefoil lectin domain protein n=1 Tax=Pseudomonas sp. GM33 TaxID=1144329 RepID=UPI0002703D2A|nr:ricin-type beta-trefoil lectin domain protein [Pseudomonas sp. GM33]EJM33812.1 putative carbohydrate-binding protein [Pseudomonas sp. GM33]
METRREYGFKLVFFQGLFALAILVLALNGTAFASESLKLPYGVLSPDRATCSGEHLVSVVAHMDDDLLFIEPGISEVLTRGGCVTVIFMVGGSSGAGFDYVINREKASEKAYERMLGVSTGWETSIIEVGSAHLRSVVATSNSRLRLIFLRVRGGHVRGGDVPLANMFDNGALVISWPYLDEASGPVNLYSKATIIRVLVKLIEELGATKVYALNPDTVPYIEHPDHIYSARFARAALRNISDDISVAYHETYPSAGGVATVSPRAVQRKRDIAATYFHYEGAEPVSSVFSEAAWNGNWVARRNFKVTNAREAVPEVNIPLEPLVNFETQKCLAAKGGGDELSLYECNNDDAQLWSFVPSSVRVGEMGTALLKNKSGQCVAFENNRLVVKVCAGGEATQHWTPWDFGKVFTPQAGCLDASSESLVSHQCSPFKGAALWTRKIINVDSDTKVEAALVGDVGGEGASSLVQVIRRSDGPGVDVWVSSTKEGKVESKQWYGGRVAFDAASLQPTCGNNEVCYDQARYLLADFDGDGKADLMIISPGNGGGTRFSLMKSVSDHFDHPKVWAMVDFPFDYELAQQYLAGDFRGAGKPDVLIAHTRGDSGLNFWLMMNEGGSLSAPDLWAQATGLDKAAYLSVANLGRDGFADVLAFDSIDEHLRLSILKSTGDGFDVGQPSNYVNFRYVRSKIVTVTSPVTHLTDAWVLHASADGAATNFWKLVNNGDGSFTPSESPVYQEGSLAWADIQPYARTSATGNQILLVHRVNNSVGEYYWRVGRVGMKALNLTAGGIPLDLIDYGQLGLFEWANLKWRARLN